MLGQEVSIKLVAIQEFYCQFIADDKTLLFA
jgi:hypothetical protein